ncbi:MAG: EAL domain-containing protein [Rhodocyclales bacterium]|nr:EAL domain-containing protein [Rhodocyclales bacterium]
MPLTELVHYVNQRHQHVFPSQCGKDVGLKMTEGRVQGQFGAWTLDSLFQPVADSASGQVLGHEAHLYLVDAEGLSQPAESLFDLAGSDADLVFLDQFCRSLHALNFLLEKDQQDGFLSLNVHPQVLRVAGLDHGQEFETLLSRCGLSPERIVLEVTDDGLSDVNPIARALQQQRSRGYRVALDNFGRHGADLERLETLGPDIVKLDRSLIGHSGHLSLARRIVVDLSAEIRRLNSRMVCQYIENPLQLAVAREVGMDWLQGNLIGRPAIACRPVYQAANDRIAA